MIEVTGEVDQKEMGQMTRPGLVKPNPASFTHIPVLRIRVLTSSGRMVQVLYKGETPGDADIGEQIVVKGIDRGGVVHARYIFNLTTNSWVTSSPGFLGRFFGD